MTARCAVLLAGLCLAAPAVAQAPAQPPLRIGLSVPLSGPDAAFGQGLRLGAEQAVADLNRAGPRKLALAVQDDAGDPRQATAVARRLVADGVRLVVGPFESAAVAAAAPVYEEAGAVMVTPGATYAPLTGRGPWNLFRLGPSDAQQGRAAGGYLARRFAGRPVGLVHDRTTFGRGLAEAAAARLKEVGEREALFEGIERGTRDLSGLAGRLKAARVEAVYFGGLAPEAAALARALREAGLNAPLVAGDGLLDPAFAAAAGPSGEGTVMTMAPDPPRLPGGRVPRTPEAEAVAAAAYAAVEALVQASERSRAGQPREGRTEARIDGRRVAEALRAGPLRTVLGPVSFDARGDQGGEPVVLRVWRRTPDGRLDYAGNEVAP